MPFFEALLFALPIIAVGVVMLLIVAGGTRE